MSHSSSEADCPISADDIVSQLLSGSALSSLTDKINHLCEENAKLKLENASLELRLTSLETDSAVIRSKLEISEQILEQEKHAIERTVQAQYDEENKRLQHQCTDLSLKIDDLSTELTTSKENIEHLNRSSLEAKQELYGYATQLYVQLKNYQSVDSLNVAKKLLEESSKAVLVIDKLGSPLHLDTIAASNMAGASRLSNMTTITSSFAATGDSDQVLCTRDQVRLVITGELYGLKALGDVRWYRSRYGSVFKPINNAGGRSRADASVDDVYGQALTYIPTVDDLYCTIRCQFIDPVTGATLAAEVGPVVCDRLLLDTAVEGVKKNEVEVTIRIADEDVNAVAEKEQQLEKLKRNQSIAFPKPDLEGVGMGSGGVMSDYTLTLSRKRLRISKGRKFSVKLPMNHSVHIIAHSDTSSDFSIYIYGRWVSCSASTRHDRDLILALTRLFIQQNSITELSGDNEKTREKIYSSSYMLSLINISHDIHSMPRVSTTSSDVLAGIHNDLNVGQFILDHKSQPFQPLEDETFIDTIQSDLPSTLNGDAIWVNMSDFKTNAILHTHIATVDQDKLRGKRNHHGTAGAAVSKRQQQVLNNSGLLSETSSSSLSIISGQFSHSVLDIMSRDKSQVSAQRGGFSHGGDSTSPGARTISSASPPLSSVTHRNSISTSINSSRNQGPQSPSSLTSGDQDAPAPKNPSKRSEVKQIIRQMKQKASNDYVPYDIDDLTPSAGMTKERGFDDIIMSSSSSDEENDIERRNRRRQAGLDSDDDNDDSDSDDGANPPAITINIKAADEVVIDTASNATLIKQMMKRNSTLSLGLPSPVNSTLVSPSPSGTATANTSTGTSGPNAAVAGDLTSPPPARTTGRKRATLSRNSVLPGQRPSVDSEGGVTIPRTPTSTTSATTGSTTAQASPRSTTSQRGQGRPASTSVTTKTSESQSPTM